MRPPHRSVAMRIDKCDNKKFPKKKRIQKNSSLEYSVYISNNEQRHHHNANQSILLITLLINDVFGRYLSQLLMCAMVGWMRMRVYSRFTLKLICSRNKLFARPRKEQWNDKIYSFYMLIILKTQYNIRDCV